jgi:hypothetical protein
MSDDSDREERIGKMEVKEGRKEGRKRAARHREQGHCKSE